MGRDRVARPVEQCRELLGLRHHHVRLGRRKGGAVGHPRGRAGGGLRRELRLLDAARELAAREEGEDDLGAGDPGVQGRGLVRVARDELRERERALVELQGEHLGRVVRAHEERRQVERREAHGPRLGGAGLGGLLAGPRGRDLPGAFPCLLHGGGEREGSARGPGGLVGGPGGGCQRGCERKECEGVAFSVHAY